jgi:hypothetical protein
VVLNPQYKWAFFDGSWALRPEWLNTAKTKVQALWDDYKERHLGSQAGPQVMPVAVTPKPDYSKPQPLTAYMNRMAARPTRPVTIADDYERWIVDDPIEVEEGVVFNQLGWWRDNGWKYPLLAKLAINLLAVPAMSTEVERTFSSAGITSDDLRNTLLMDGIQAIECLRNWLRTAKV